jgi:ferrous iron transport protein B
MSKNSTKVKEILTRADALQQKLGTAFRDEIVETIYEDAATIASRVVSYDARRRFDLDSRIDRIVTSRLFGLPIMLLLLTFVFWLTVTAANYPSELIAIGLFWIEDQLAMLFQAVGAPWWFTGFLVHGVWRGLAWVVSVMLPPMAIFFPIFTILEDLGYLPRVAFNMDRLFKKAGAHGKQALTMGMGFGCNAAGVISCRVIESPRERLIAIITNNFVPCNGRFPTLIMLATVFVAAAFPPALASVVAAGAVVGMVVLGVATTLVVSAVLSRTFLKGEVSAFALELPSYRRPKIGQILYTSLIDRSLFVLYRAVVFAAPAGGLIWLLGNISVSGRTLMSWASGALDPFGALIGLDGVILLAYVVAIPANEIVVPTILMGYLNAGMMTEITSLGQLRQLLVDQNGWTLLTAINLMLFVVHHNPCSTTIWTIWKETGSARWTIASALMPLAIGFTITFVVAQVARLLGWV